MNFAPPVKAFSLKFGRAILILCQVLAFCESSLSEMVTLTDPQNFSPSKVYRYTVYWRNLKVDSTFRFPSRGARI